MSSVISLTAARFTACWGFHEDLRAAVFQDRCYSEQMQRERWGGFKGVSIDQYFLSVNQTAAHLQ